MIIDGQTVRDLIEVTVAIPVAFDTMMAFLILDGADLNKIDPPQKEVEYEEE